ncbi:hypothetical protein EDD85DRAFT_794104 [Armillaria nabsnona]|nr:hypothetical protein EDD85DRAFT_794104 [Armillaria nabsnona]
MYRHKQWTLDYEGAYGESDIRLRSDEIGFEAFSYFLMGLVNGIVVNVSFHHAIRIVDKDDDKKEKGDRTAHWTSDNHALPKVETPEIPVMTPTWGTEEEHNNDIKQGEIVGARMFPRRAAVFSFPGEMCGEPSQFLGPKRYAEWRHKIEKVLAVVILHDHYDQYTQSSSAPSAARVFQSTHSGHNHPLQANPSPRIFAPLGNEGCLKSIRIPNGHARWGLLNQGKTLWSSWTVEGQGKKVYFACIPDTDRSKMGRIRHRDWTWILTQEEIYEPPKRLAEGCKKIGIGDGDFSRQQYRRYEDFQYCIDYCVMGNGLDPWADIVTPAVAISFSRPSNPSTGLISMELNPGRTANNALVITPHPGYFPKYQLDRTNMNVNSLALHLFLGGPAFIVLRAD